MVKNVMYGALLVGLISLVLGIISRLILAPIVVEAHAFLDFTSICFLFSLNVGLLQLLKARGE